MGGSATERLGDLEDWVVCCTGTNDQIPNQGKTANLFFSGFPCSATKVATPTFALSLLHLKIPTMKTKMLQPLLFSPGTPAKYDAPLVMVNGETNLAVLIKTMRPVLNEGRYVFCRVWKQEVEPDQAIFYFKEKEGITVVCSKAFAEQKGYEFATVFAWITLEVHSSLQAVGLTAAFSNALAQKDISCNVVAGFYHDHIFVPESKASEAIETLQNLSNSFSER
jgi:uncharacterized protein